MALSLLGPFNKVINQTATQIVDSELPTKLAEVLKTVVSSSFGIVDDVLKQVQDLTAEDAATTARNPRKRAR